MGCHIIILDRFKRCTDPVAQGCKPVAGKTLTAVPFSAADRFDAAFLSFFMASFPFSLLLPIHLISVQHFYQRITSGRKATGNPMPLKHLQLTAKLASRCDTPCRQIVTTNRELRALPATEPVKNRYINFAVSSYSNSVKSGKQGGVMPPSRVRSYATAAQFASASGAGGGGLVARCKSAFSFRERRRRVAVASDPAHAAGSQGNA